MKSSLVLLLLPGIAVSALADIQNPPSSDYGPTRKLSRGLSNMLFGATEIPVTIGDVNCQEGNAAAATYGLTRGAGRAFARFGVGLYEVLLWPLPIHHRSYMPALGDDIQSINRGYSEYPPEPGNESRYPYVRQD